MTATKMNAQEIIQFIANAEKKTSVKVTFEGQLATAVPSSVVKLGNVLFGDWKDVAPLLDGLVENQDYVVEQDARNSAVPLLDKRAINARIEPGAIIRDQVKIITMDLLVLIMTWLNSFFRMQKLYLIAFTLFNI